MEREREREREREHIPGPVAVWKEDSALGYSEAVKGRDQYFSWSTQRGQKTRLEFVPLTIDTFGAVGKQKHAIAVVVANARIIVKIAFFPASAVLSLYVKEREREREREREPEERKRRSGNEL